MVSLSERDVQRKGLKVSEEMPEMVQPPGQPARLLVPDVGFAVNPARVAWEPDLTKYPDELRRAYERRVTEEL